MLSLKKIFHLGLLIYCIISSSLFAFYNEKHTEQNKINILLIADDNYGSSFVIGYGKIKSIKQQFEEFGWNMIISSVKDTIEPCDWGRKTFGNEKIIVNRKISKIIEFVFNRIFICFRSDNKTIPRVIFIILPDNLKFRYKAVIHGKFIPGRVVAAIWQKT